ncbi:MAG TPA: hypothetical protein VMV92_31250 [Streptosporangiaceae bacterium]|nr:hypothetical protein [Streptosporangiaceae bacterium]
MCAPGSACGCGSASSDIGGGAVILLAGVVTAGGIVAFLAVHLLLLAAATVAIPVATLAAVRFLRRYVVLVHKQPARQVRRAALAALPVTIEAQPVPALEGPAARLAVGSYHLHFHGVSAEDVVAIIRREGVAALPAVEHEPRV